MWKSLKLFGKDLIVETIAVFIGITLALIIDSVKDDNRVKRETHNYFGLIESQLIRDTMFAAQMLPDLRLQHEHIDTFIQKDHSPQILQYAEETFIYEPPIELLNSLFSSSSFNSIYDSVIYNAMISQMSDFKLYKNIQFRIEETQKNFLVSYIYPVKNPLTNEIPIVTTDNRMLNCLGELNQLHKARYMTLLSIQLNYRILLEQIAVRIHHGN